MAELSAEEVLAILSDIEQNDQLVENMASSNSAAVSDYKITDWLGCFSIQERISKSWQLNDVNTIDTGSQ